MKHGSDQLPVNELKAFRKHEECKSVVLFSFLPVTARWDVCIKAARERPSSNLHTDTPPPTLLQHEILPAPIRSLRGHQKRVGEKGLANQMRSSGGDSQLYPPDSRKCCEIRLSHSHAHKFRSVQSTVLYLQADFYGLKMWS